MLRGIGRFSPSILDIWCYMLPISKRHVTRRFGRVHTGRQVGTACVDVPIPRRCASLRTDTVTARSGDKTVCRKRHIQASRGLPRNIALSSLTSETKLQLAQGEKSRTPAHTLGGLCGVHRCCATRAQRGLRHGDGSLPPRTPADSATIIASWVICDGPLDPEAWRLEAGGWIFLVVTVYTQVQVARYAYQQTATTPRPIPYLPSNATFSGSMSFRVAITWTARGQKWGRSSSRCTSIDLAL